MSIRRSEYKSSATGGDADDEEGVDQARDRLSDGDDPARVDEDVDRDAGREATTDAKRKEPEEIRAFEIRRRFQFDRDVLQQIITGERLTWTTYRRRK